MEIKMSGWDFEKIHKGCSKFVDKYGSRRILRFIELRAKDGFCVATALDGFGLWQIKVPCEGEGVTLLPSVKPFRADEVTISNPAPGRVKIEYINAIDGSVIATEYPIDETKYFDWGKILPIGRVGDRYIACTVKLLKNALDALKNTGDVVYIGVPEDPVKPITLTAETSQAIVLPVRVNNGLTERASLARWRGVDDE